MSNSRCPREPIRRSGVETFMATEKNLIVPLGGSADHAQFGVGGWAHNMSVLVASRRQYSLTRSTRATIVSLPLFNPRYDENLTQLTSTPNGRNETIYFFPEPTSRLAFLSVSH